MSTEQGNQTPPPTVSNSASSTSYVSSEMLRLVGGTILAVGVTAFVVRKAVHASRVKKHGKANGGNVPESPDSAGATPIILENEKGIELYVRRWDVAKGKELKGVVVMLHGDILPSSFFADFAKELVSNGFVVYAYDMVGYGVSGWSKGVERHIPDYNDYVSDLERVVDLAVSAHPGTKCFLYGEDLGATVAIEFTLDEARKQKVEGMVLTAPLIEAPAVKSVPSGLAESLCSTGTGPSIVTNYSLEDLFADPDVVAAAEEAFESFKKPTNKKYMEVKRLCEHVAENMAQVETPFLLLHGQADKKNPPDLSNKFQASASSKVNFIRPYPEIGHGVLHSGGDRRRFPYSDSVAWLNKQATGEYQ